jgi:hypothetical protein
MFLVYDSNQVKLYEFDCSSNKVSECKWSGKLETLDISDNFKFSYLHEDTLLLFDEQSIHRVNIFTSVKKAVVESNLLIFILCRSRFWKPVFAW